MATWRVFFRNRTFSRAAELDTYKLDAVLRFNALSTWRLTLPASLPQADEIDLTGGGIIVTRDDTVMLSGLIRRRKRTHETITLEGSDDTEALKHRLCYPTLSGPPFTDEYDERTAAAETVIRGLVEDNAGPTAARVDRRTAGLQDVIGADTGLGDTVTVKARLHNLLELAAEIALQGGGLGFRVAQRATNISGTELQVWQPTDRTASVHFSIDLGTLRDYADQVAGPEANAILAGGVGVADERIFVERSDNASIASCGVRIEGYYDRRAEITAAELYPIADGILAGSAATRSTELTTADTAAVEFGTDYNLGDLVRAIIDGESVDGVVREVAIEITEDAERITPTIGTPGAGQDPAIANQMAAVRRRLAYLELNTVPGGSLTSAAYGAGSVTSAAIGAGSVTTTALASGSVTRAVLDSVSRTPIGVYYPYAGATLPAGYLWCDGSAVSQTTYADLYAVLGTTWNTGGEGAGNFRLPALADRFVMGKSGTKAHGSTGGAASIDIRHNHPHDHGGTTGVCDQTEDGTTGSPQGLLAADGHAHEIPSDSTAATWNVGGDGSTVSILPPYLASNWIIYAGV